MWKVIKMWLYVKTVPKEQANLKKKKKNQK